MEEAVSFTTDGTLISSSAYPPLNSLAVQLLRSLLGTLLPCKQMFSLIARALLFTLMQV
jgi:hypothetical protein